MSLPRIGVVYHSFGTCPTQFAEDLARALRFTGTIIPAVMHEQSCYVDSARNKLVKRFLAEQELTHMMMVDVDLSFESDAFLRTFFILQAANADVVYGNYALGNGANSIFGPPENAANEAAVRVNLEPNKVYQDIATGGTGWLMATRQLLERMGKECPGPWHWFARDPTADGKDLRGEDITFGLRMWRMEPRPRVVGTTSVLLRHLKNQGFFPEHMQGEALRRGTAASGIVIGNPFEQDKERYHCFGNAVIDKSSLKPEERAKLEKMIAEGNLALVDTANSGASDAVSQSSAAGSNGDSGARTEQAPAPEPGPAEDVSPAVARLRGNEAEGPAEAQAPTAN